MKSDLITPGVGTAAFFESVLSPARFNFFMLTKLPAAWFSGLKLITANEHQCSVSVPFRWFTQNPFGSTYFACLSMAAEMSTGILAQAHIYKKQPAISMLIISSEGRYFKKAKGKTIFTCMDGAAINDAIRLSIETGAGQTINVKSSGYNKDGELIVEFFFTWSFKQKSHYMPPASGARAV
jgi:hypothetical protein